MKGGCLELISKMECTRMKIKKYYRNLYINLHNQLKNCLSRKVWKNYYSMYIQERGWVNAQILLTNC